MSELSANDIWILITGIPWILCIPLGTMGGLVSIWIDPEIGKKMINSALVVGVPSLILCLIVYEPENTDKKATEGGGSE